ncbi:hypothetical protein [Edwardsiella tarda]|uniref:hypothetical protein n=1 Tax=Edwardsiella tarda TaxID=636 RepID=UPI0002DB40E8|nr:hypothetical protein [Edwardsiella tarda]
MDVKPDVSFQERASINNGLRMLNREKRWDCGSTQMTRVIIAAAGADWYTLRGLERRMLQLFPHEGDTQAAISARLRQISVARHGLVKQVRKVRNPGSGKTVWFYRLVPASRDGGV